MAILVSPGVSVTVTDDSFYIPASAPTVPLIFIATADEKKQPTGADAEGTFEHDVIRTVTTAQQSVQLYGVPRFLTDYQGNPLHGDCRNEYGLFALNQFLGIADMSYVIRANVNLDDDRDNILSMWSSKMQNASQVLQNLLGQRISIYNAQNGYTSASPNYKTTVTQSELISDAETALALVYDSYSFRNVQSDFETDHTAAPLAIYANGYDHAQTGQYLGFDGMAAAFVANNQGSVVPTQFTPQEGSNLLLDAANDFQYTVQFLNETTLGANDAARRVAIVQALAATINSNTDIRSETYEYNLVLCPGYHEIVNELSALVVDIMEEAFVIGETPMTMNPDDVVSKWADTTTSDRVHSPNIAYYYPHGLATNLDGAPVAIAASGIALRTYAYSDSVSQLWFAPAGTQRGLVSGVDQVGYITGTLGSATTFVPVALTNGQRDNMYKFTTNINPIANLPGRGIIILGQKTSSPDSSAMDRVNVSRLIKYIKRSLRKNVLPFLFEPNDQITRNNVKAVVDAFLGDILVKRGLYDFVTLCDASNNTPDRIDNGELYIDIALKPEKAVEFIYVPIRIVGTGAALTSN